MVCIFRNDLGATQALCQLVKVKFCLMVDMLKESSFRETQK